MCDKSQPIFDDFNEYVNRMKAELASVDAKYVGNDAGADECAKYCEKLSIYTRYTDDLINNGFQYLDIIDHLKKELAANNCDTSSLGSNSSICEGTVHDDLNFIRKCLENRTGMEEKAFDSLVQVPKVQGVVDGLLRDYGGLVKENERLNAQLKKVNKSPRCRPHYTDQICTLQKENDLLKEKINRISKSSNQCGETFKTDCNSKRLKDCETEIELLKQQLARKDKTIEKLLFKHRNESSLRKYGSIESTSSESIGSNTFVHGNCLHRTRSDGCASYRSCATNNLSEYENRDTAKIQALKNGYKELTQILKEKYAQLRKQRTKIDELMAQLKNFADLECTMEQLRRDKEQLEYQIRNQPNDLEPLNKMKRQIEKCNNEVERLRRREDFLNRKVASQDEHIATLLVERKSLIKINDEMKRSICLCERELCKYCN